MFRLKSPLRAQIELTEACNNACIHCYNYWRYLKTGKKLKTDDRERTLDHFSRILKVIIDQDIGSITFTGGEPLIRKDILFDLIKIARDAELQVSINSNAALITEKDIFRFKELGVDSFLISLLSHNAKTHNTMALANSYSRTIRGIQRLVEAGLCPSVNMVTSQANIKDVKKTAELVKEIGVKSFTATPILSCHLSQGHNAITLSPEQIKKSLTDLSWAKEYLGLDVGVLEPLPHCMFTEKERSSVFSITGFRYCCAGISDCAISPDGDVRPCILSSEIGGNIFKDGWDKSWHNLSQWKSSDMLPPDCLKCKVVDYCGGGCRVSALAKNGGITAKDPYMTSPILEDSPSIIRRQDSVNLSNSQNLNFLSSLRTRKEEFGGVIFFNEEFLFLNKDSFNLIISIINERGFSVDNIATKFQLEKSHVQNFFAILLKKGFLEKEVR